MCKLAKVSSGDIVVSVCGIKNLSFDKITVEFFTNLRFSVLFSKLLNIFKSLECTVEIIIVIAKIRIICC